MPLMLRFTLHTSAVRCGSDTATEADCSQSHRRSLGGGRGGGTAPPKSEPIDFVRSINTKIFSHCLILFALSYFNEYVKAKLFIINVKKKNLRDEKNQKLAPICDVSGQIFRSFHTAHRKRFDCKFIRREDRGHLRKTEMRRILLH